MTIYSEPQPLAPDPGGSPGRRPDREQRRTRRRRAVRRLDILLGLVVGAVWVLLAPGIAMAGVIAIAVLALAGVSLLAGRVRRRRAGHTGAPRTPRRGLRARR